jgi:hypothetical protein
MRYTVRWNNGYWKIFDTRQYRDVEKFGTEVDAKKALASFNSQKQQGGK